MKLSRIIYILGVIYIPSIDVHETISPLPIVNNAHFSIGFAAMATINIYLMVTCLITIKILNINMFDHRHNELL